MTGLSTTGVEVTPGEIQTRFAHVTIAVPGATGPDGSSPAIVIDARAVGLQCDNETGDPVTIAGRTWR